MKPEDVFNDWLETQPLLSVNPLFNGEWYLTSTQVFDFANYYAERLKNKPKRNRRKFEDGEQVKVVKGPYKNCVGKFKYYNQPTYEGQTVTVSVSTPNGDIERLIKPSSYFGKI